MKSIMGFVAFGIVAIAMIRKQQQTTDSTATDTAPPDDSLPIEPDAPSGESDAMSDAYSPQVRDLAHAIAVAEGFGAYNAIPTRAHNPGDLIVPKWDGPKLGAEGISVFPSDAAGWAALYRQIQLIVDGRSRVYALDDSLQTMGRRWAPADGDTWANNVATWYQSRGWLTVTVATTIRELVS